MATGSHEFARPLVAVDVLLFTVRDFWSGAALEQPRLEVGLIERAQAPHAGRLALPGTVLRVEPDAETGAVDASFEDAAARALAAKVGIAPLHTEQLGSWYFREADPRGPVVVVAYMAVVSYEIFRGAPPPALRFAPVDALPPLAFDHDRLIRAGVERVRGKAAYSTLPALLLPEIFSLTELRRMYEAIFSRSFDQGNFIKKVEGLGILDEVVPDAPGTAAVFERLRRQMGTLRRRPTLYRLKSRRLTTFERTAF